jgi:hypothetical protein
MENNQDQDKIQNSSFSYCDDEDIFEKIYGVKSRDASDNNSENSLTLGSTYQSNLFSSPEKYSNIHFFCRKCSSIPILEFKSVLNIMYTCGCNKNFLMNIITYFDNTLKISEESEEKDIEKKKEKENNILLEYFYCKKHKGQKFFAYCKECDISLCSECLINEESHKDQLIFFDKLLTETNKKLEFIIKNFSLIPFPYDNESSDYLDDNLEIVKEYYIKFINVLINDYNNYTCYSHFVIISNLNKALEIIITSSDNLKKYINVNPNLNLITGIRLVENDICDITKFCEANLINLKFLLLRGNNISNLESLIYAKFKNIEILDFSLNKLGDDNIEKISQLQFENLTILNLFGNNFSAYKLFYLCNNNKLKSLKTLYFGSNNFNNNKINTTIDASKLEIIGLTNGVFNNESIYFIQYFRFNNLQKLYLHSNNLSSLSFIEDLNLPNIKEIWVNNNSINEYYSLCKYKTLEFINIRRNCIKNIERLISFIEEFIQLKKIDIRYNNINFNDNKNENIILEAKKRFVDIDYI